MDFCICATDKLMHYHLTLTCEKKRPEQRDPNKHFIWYSKTNALKVFAATKRPTTKMQRLFSDETHFAQTICICSSACSLEPTCTELQLNRLPKKYRMLVGQGAFRMETSTSAATSTRSTTEHAHSFQCPRARPIAVLHSERRNCEPVCCHELTSH